ncbi:MAG: metallophosphoesterase [Bacteroidetes bacterium]|nr:metallophosphoesterase [Bacteroidota bacterium]
MRYLLYSLQLVRFIYVGALFLVLAEGASAQSPNIILGRPTDTSVTASIMFTTAQFCYVEYGAAPSSYSNTTPIMQLQANVPEELLINKLNADSRYWYRVRYNSSGSGVFATTPEYNFHTQRKPGSAFTFTIEADEHLYDKKGIANMYKVTLANQAADQPDFMLSLGDIFGDDHQWKTITSPEVDVLHRNYRPFLGAVCHSIPFYVCLGNHEGENDYYYLQKPGANLCVWGTQSRKNYYPNPFPNGFYSGNADVEPYGIGNPENYYAWVWGDAQFIVLDVYRDQCDSSDKPLKWAWTLGKKQYDWLKNTLAASTSKYKFVFAHHVRGQGRGGITNATQFEWGGLDGTKDLFATNRTGWDKPIHKLFVDNKVNIFFQGHDHVFAHETLDGVVYQACPMAADSTYEIGMLANADAYVSDTFPGTGHLRVHVGDDGVKVDFVRAYLPKDTLGIRKNREVPFSYTVGGLPQQQIELLDASVRVWPNPAENRLYIELPEALRGATLTLSNLQGQTLLHSAVPEMDLSRLSPGCYLLHMQHHQTTLCRKVWVNR